VCIYNTVLFRRYVTHIGEMRIACNISVWEMLREEITWETCTWMEDNFQMDLREIGLDSVRLILWLSIRSCERDNELSGSKKGEDYLISRAYY
jgi:hypothetical protein